MRKIIITLLLFLVIIPNSFINTLAIEIHSPSAVVISSQTGRILYNHNAFEKRKMASLTKMMTAIILCETCNMDELIEIDSKACYIGGSEAGIMPNTKVSARDLLYGMLLPSGNDCALAIGYHIGNGNISNFATLMNKKANELNLKDTNFVNPHGLDDDNHYSSAYSMAQITREALNYPEIRTAIGTQTKVVNFDAFTKELNNTNRLLRTYSKTIGGKTGYTDGANRCLINVAKDNDLELISVVLGSENTDIRFNDSKDILEYCFENYKLRNLDNFLNIYVNIPVYKGNIDSLEINFKDTKQEVLTDDEYNKIYVKTNFPNELIPPVHKGEYLGSYSLLIDSEEIYRKDFYLEENIEKLTSTDYLNKIIKNMFNETEKI